MLILLGHVDRFTRILSWVLLFIAVLIFGLLALANLVVSSRAGAIMMTMAFLGSVAIAVIFGKALRHGHAVMQPSVVLAVSILLMLGSWSIVSASVMQKQVEQLSGGHPYTITFRTPGIESLQDVDWWRFRGAAFKGPTVEGVEHPNFYFHATLIAGVERNQYNWSKRSMRFDLVQR